MVGREVSFYYPNSTLVGICRGQQRAEALGSMSNERNDLTKLGVFVRAVIDIDHHVTDAGFPVLLDPGDCPMIAAMMAHSFKGGSFIGATNMAVKYLHDTFGRRAFYIPDHHCNFERRIRPADRPVRTVGYVGSIIGIDFNLKLLQSALENAGFEFKSLIVDTPADATREDVCTFIESLDIMVSFRKACYGVFRYSAMMPTLKILNALSFKVPIVCEQQEAYDSAGLSGCYVHVDDFGKTIEACEALRDIPDFYVSMVEPYYDSIVESYHIDTIVKKYLEVLP